jgi:hypothetical protein
MAVQKYFSKRDFSAGQYDREYQAVESDISSRGLVYARNVISSPLREIKTRPGIRHLADLDGPAKIIPFRINDDDIALLFQEGKYAGYKFNDKFEASTYNVFTGDRPYWPSTGWGSNTNGNWTVGFSRATTPSQAFKMCNRAGFSYYNKGTLCTTNPTAGMDAFLYLTNSSVPVSMESVVIRFVYFVSSGRNPWAIHKGWVKPVFQYSDDNVTWTPVATEQSNPYGAGTEYRTTSYIKRFGVESENSLVYRARNVSEDYSKHRFWRIFFAGVVTGLNLGYRLELFISDENGSANNQPAYGVEFLPANQTPFVVNNSPFSLSDLSIIKYSQDENQLVLTVNKKQPYQIKYNNGAFTYGNFTPEKTPNIWNLHGYPSCVRHFDNRLWFGGFTSFKNRVIASRFNDPQDFNTDTTINAGSPVVADCNQMKSRITDLYGGWTVLYAQSQEGMATIQSGNTAIAPNNMEFKLKIDKRSAGLTPAIKDNVMFYISKDQKSIYAIQFDLIADKYQVSDVTKFGHSYFNSGIQGIFYPDTYDRLIYGILGNGKFFALLYDSEYNVVGVFPLETDGFIYDMAVIQANGELRILAVIQRNSSWNLEIFNPVKELIDTDDFDMNSEQRDKATKQNIQNQPFIDSIKSSKIEKFEIWNFDFTNSLLYAQASIRNGYNIGEVVTENNFFYTSLVNDNRVEPSQDTGSNWKNLTPEWEEGQAYAKDVVVSIFPDYYKSLIDDNTTDPTAEPPDPPEPENPEEPVEPVEPTWEKLTYDDVVVMYLPTGPWHLPIITSSSGLGNTPLDDYMQQVLRFFDNDDEVYDLKLINKEAEFVYKVEILQGNPGVNTSFSKLQFPQYKIGPEIIIPNKSYQVIDSGRYLGEVSSGEDGVLNFENPVYDLIYGLGYRKIGIIQDNHSYLRKKEWGSIALNVMDTMSLKIGSRIDKLENVMKWKGNYFYNSSPIMKNGILIANIADEPENDKQLIFMTDEGLSFVIRAIEAAGEISDRNQN